MEIEELAEQVKSLQDKVESTTKETEGLQSLIGKWSGEVGKIRESLKDAGGDDAVKQKLDSLESELKEMKAQPPQGGQPKGEAEATAKPSEPRKTPEDEANELETSLTEDQRKLVEEAWNNLDDKSKWDDPKFRVAVFKEAQTQGPSVPKSPWRAQKTEQPKPDDLSRIVKGLFKSTRKRAANVPPGSGGVGATGGSSGEGGPKYYDGRTSYADFLKSPRQ